MSATDLVEPALRVRGVRALMSFNSIDVARALALDRALVAVHPTVARYVPACKRIMFNLASNPSLHAIVDEELVYMTDEGMARGTIVERVQQQEKQRHESYVNMLKEKQDAMERTQTESVLHCRKCRSSNLNFVQVQVRSADEPMSCFLTCNACGYKWRMS